MEMNVLKDMVLGKPAPLVSTFRLSYYSILNLMSRAEGQFTAEHVIKNSFHQFQYEKVAFRTFIFYDFVNLSNISFHYSKNNLPFSIQALPDMGLRISKLEKEAAMLDSSGEVCLYR